MDATKIRLSPQEMGLVTNAELILTKNVIMQKAKWLLEDLQNDMTAFVTHNHTVIPPEVLKPSPKISKGENYKGLPYLVLDYPRFFQKENIFAIRCMFWWGNFFSITLHITGDYKSQLENALRESYRSLLENDFYLCVNQKEWEHDFEQANYNYIREMPSHLFMQNILSSSFIKIARKYSLAGWDHIHEMLLNDFRFLVNIRSAQLPKR